MATLIHNHKTIYGFVRLSNLRKNIIKLLEFPRKILQDNLATKIDSCAHSCLYCKDDETCQECHDGPECSWLYRNDYRAELDKKGLKQLIHELEFVILSVQALVAQWQHESLSCQCETCEWLRKTQDLFDELHRPGLQTTSVK